MLAIWRHPLMRSDRRSIFVAFVIIGIGIAWLALSTFGVNYKAVDSIREVLPRWFPIADLFFAPVLVALASGPLPISSILRLVAFIATLLSLSTLYLSYLAHPHAALVEQVGLWIEAFLIVPAWNRWTRRRKLSLDEIAAEDEKEAVKPRLRHRPIDLILYIAIGIALAWIATLYALQAQSSSKLPAGRWTGLGIETAFVFTYHLGMRRMHWKRTLFWECYVGFLAIHVLAWVMILSKMSQFQFDWFIFLGLCEWVLLGIVLDRVLKGGFHAARF